MESWGVAMPIYWKPILLSSTKVNDPGPPVPSSILDLDELALLRLTFIHLMHAVTAYGLGYCTHVLQT